jgi:hypothetical protein
MSDLESRLRRLEDRAELEDLVVRYFVASDDDDYETLASTFASDGTFSAGIFPGGAGRDAVVECLRSGRNMMGPTIHTPSYTLFDFQSENRASGLVGAHLELSIGEQTIFAAVRYIDEYEKNNGRWQFKRREMRTIHAGPWEEVGTSLSAELCIRWPGVSPMKSDFPKKGK